MPSGSSVSCGRQPSVHRSSATGAKATVATVTGALDAGDQSKAKGGHKGKGEKAESAPAKAGEAPKAASREPGKK